MQRCQAWVGGKHSIWKQKRQHHQPAPGVTCKKLAKLVMTWGTKQTGTQGQTSGISLDNPPSKSTCTEINRQNPACNKQLRLAFCYHSVRWRENKKFTIFRGKFKGRKKALTAGQPSLKYLLLICRLSLWYKTVAHFYQFLWAKKVAIQMLQPQQVWFKWGNKMFSFPSDYSAGMCTFNDKWLAL